MTLSANSAARLVHSNQEKMFLRAPSSTSYESTRRQRWWALHEQNWLLRADLCHWCHPRFQGSGNLRLAVQLPEGEDTNEWLAVHSAQSYVTSTHTKNYICAHSCRFLQSPEHVVWYCHWVLYTTRGSGQTSRELATDWWGRIVPDYVCRSTVGFIIAMHHIFSWLVT